MATEHKFETELLAQSSDDVEWNRLVTEGTPPAIQQSIDAFRKDLDEMLAKYRGKWVAYHRGRQIGFASSQLKLYKRCAREGLPMDELLICGVSEGAFDPDEEIVYSRYV